MLPPNEPARLVQVATKDVSAGQSVSSGGWTPLTGGPMKRLAGAWVVGLFCVMRVGVWGGGAGSWAQEAGTLGVDAGRLMTQVADSQRAQDALLAELAAAHASDLAAAAATTTALTAEIS